MTDVDRLRSLAEEVAWPPTPDVAARLELGPPRRLHPLALAVALALLALAIAFAVPPARSAILRFFGLGGVTIERVETLPAAVERPLAVGIGAPIGSAEAQRRLGVPFRPYEHGQLYGSDDVVSTLLATPAPVLLSEFGSPQLLKKLATDATLVQSVDIAPGLQGLFLTGGHHVVVFPQVSPRLAGTVLVWVSRGITFRLEGRTLTEEKAVELARRITGTDGG